MSAEEQAKNVLEIVRSAIATELEIPLERFDVNASLRTAYLLDSVAAINILFALEGALCVEIDPAEIAAVDSAAEISDRIISLLNR